MYIHTDANRATPQPPKEHRVHQYRGPSTSILETKSSVHDVADTTRKRLASDPRVETPWWPPQTPNHETTMTDDGGSMKHSRVLNLPTTTQLERLMQVQLQLGGCGQTSAAQLS